MKTINTHGSFEEAVSNSSEAVRQIAVKLRILIAELYPQVVEVPWPKQRIIGYGVGPKKRISLAPKKHISMFPLGRSQTLQTEMFRSLYLCFFVILLTGCLGRSGTLVPTPDGEVYTMPSASTAALAQTPPSMGDSKALPPASSLVIEEYAVPAGSHPHDVAPAPDGTVWYTAQHTGELGKLDPETGETHHIPLGNGSAPHGVIVGPDGAPWVTDSGLNAILRVDPGSEAVTAYPILDGSGYANLNTAVFDEDGVLWFTGQSGFYGRLDPAVGEVEAFEAPRGRGPYGIAVTPGGNVYFASLAGSHIAKIDSATNSAEVLEPPTSNQGARRIWSDSQGRLWVSEWNAGQLAMYNPITGVWREWRLPGDAPKPYAVYVDEFDAVWLSDFSANALLRFDPLQETFDVFPLPSPGASVRQMLGRPGEVWGAESGTDKLVVVRVP
jgi:virginiamycin B lyase